jgi:hypothetical protein
MSEPKKYICCCCIMRGMRVRTDKKGRLFWQCESCGTIIFPRCGHMGLFAIASTFTLLEAPDAQKFVRTNSYVSSERGESALMELLRPAPSADSLAPRLSPEAQAEIRRTGS